MNTSIHLLIALFFPVLLVAQTECDPNNSFGNACPILISNLMGTINGSINPVNDVDFYSFNIPRSGVITYTVTNVPGNIAIQAALFHESNQGQAVSSVSGGNGISVEGIKKVCPAGKYYIKLNDNPGSPDQSPIQYNLKVTLDTTDVYECNENFVDCTPMTLNQNIKGTINSSGDIDFYCFDIPRSGVITYTVTNVPGNIAMQAALFHESNQGQAVSSASGGNGISVEGIKKVCLAGKYYIKLNDNPGSPDQSPFQYNLKVTLDTTDVYECNENFVDCTPMTLNQNIKGTINSSGDIDFYCFDIPRSGVITYTVSNVPGNIAMQAALFHESNQGQAVSSASGGNGISVEGIKKVCPAGKYYIKLNDNPGSPEQSPIQYNLKVTLDTTDVYECNDGFASASMIASCDTVQAAINTAGDKDFYKFIASSADTVYIKVEGIPSNIHMEGQLFKSDFNQLTSIYSSGGNQQPLNFKYKLPISGTYFLVLNDKNNDAENPSLYKLHINVDCIILGTNLVLENKINIYPNPAIDKLFIDIGDLNELDFSFNVINSMGEIILSEVSLLNSKSVDLILLPKGMYFLQIVGKEGLVNKQFVKI